MGTRAHRIYWLPRADTRGHSLLVVKSQQPAQSARPQLDVGAFIESGNCLAVGHDREQ